MKEEERLNWMDIARQYEIKSKRTGKVVQNGNQDVQKFAKEMGFEVDTQARIRRAKKKLQDYSISFTPARSSKEIRLSVKDKIEASVTNLGGTIAPKIFVEKKNSENGEIIERSYEVDGHMYLINEIRNRDIERLSKIGALRNTKKVNYPELPPNSVAERLKAIGLYETRQKLDCYETIRNFAVWSDHSDIVSHSHFLFLIS
jgi:hypothetical protein